MRSIILESVTIEHFKSFTDRVVVDLSTGAGLKFFGGDNQREPRLGANGAGKSSFWDAINFCLYGTAVRGGRAAQLVSWGEKTIYVGTRWRVDGQAVNIERTSAPNKLCLNDQPVEQIDVDRAIGISRARFLQAVLFGQAVPLFLDLSVPDRGVLLDEVLDLSLWMKLSELAAKKHKVALNQLAGADRDIAFEKGREAGLEDPAVLIAKAEAWQQENQAQISQFIDAVAEAEQAEAKYSLTKTAKSFALDALKKTEASTVNELVSTRGGLLADARRLTSNIVEVEAEAEFFAHTKTCPTCAQQISHELATRREAEKREIVKRIEIERDMLNSQISGLNTRIDQAQRTQQSYERDHAELTRALHQAEALAAEQDRVIMRVTKQIEAAAAQINPHLVAAEELAELRRTIVATRRAAEGTRRRIHADVIKFDYWSAGFKRVRLFLIKRVLAHLELEVMNAANALGLPGWKIKFTTELETVSGALRPGVHVQVSSPLAEGTWELWSGGEAQRLRIAVAIGLATLIQRMAGVSFKFEVFDEPSAWLSAEGIEDLLDCLRRRAEQTGKSLWLCDHRALTYSGFAEIWQVEKTMRGSQVSLLNKAN